MWQRKTPVIVEIHNLPLRIKLPSRYHFQAFLVLACLFAGLSGWVFGSGLVLLTQIFNPSESLQAQKRLLEFKTMPGMTPNFTNLNQNWPSMLSDTEAMMQHSTPRGESLKD